MKIQKLLVGAIVGTIFLFLIDWLYYGIIMKDEMDMPGARAMPDMMWLVISYIIFSVAFVSIYGAWASGGTKVSSGLNFGIWIGVLGGLAMNLMWFSLVDYMTLSGVFTDAAYTIVKYILLGIIVAYATGIPGGDRGKDGGGGQ